MNDHADPPVPPDKHKKAKGTEYQVFFRDADNKGWYPHALVDAANSADAIKKSLSGGQAGTFAAVPARSWKPVTVHVETTSRMRLESAYSHIAA